MRWGNAQPPVLVTGATGFVGRAVMGRLLASGRSVVALARPGPGQGAAARVAEAVGVPAGDPRLRVVEADLAEPDGLVVQALSGFRTTVETVIHCAGDAVFFPQDPARFHAGHVEGPLAALRALADGGLRRWTQISTAFICGLRTGRVFEHEGDVGQDFHNPYERVKLAAEEAIGAAGKRLGVDVLVLRPSVVVGASPATAGGTPSGLFFDFIRLVAGLARTGLRAPLRIPARPRARFNIVGVEDVAAAICALAQHADAAGATCHLVAADAPTQDTMLDLIAGRFGVSGVRLVDRLPGDPSALELRVGRALAPYRPYLEQDVTFDDTTARALLAQVGTPPPRMDAATVDHLIDLALTSAPRGPRPREARR